MPLSLSVSFTLHTARLFSLLHSCTHKNTCTKEKVIVSTFTRAPSFLSFLSLQPSSLSRRFTCSFLALLCRDYPPLYNPPSLSLPPGRCTNTADRRWRRCHDTVACRPTNPSQSASQQAPSGHVCVFETVFSFGVCISIFYGLSICVCVGLSCSLNVVSLHSFFTMMIFNAVCPPD